MRWASCDLQKLRLLANGATAISMTDYLLYLVTDSTMVPSGATFVGQVEAAIAGGATLVQLREKTLLTRDFIERARKVHELTRKKGIPLIINDRVDVALAVGAEGVHVGQDDMPASLVRQLLGPEKIVGVTCSSVAEVEEVNRTGVVDYVGLGTVYATATKKDTKAPSGPIGMRKMLQALDPRIKSVAIGGINHTNAAKVLYQTSTEKRALDGVAVVSCIMASEDAKGATERLAEDLKDRVPWVSDLVGNVDKPLSLKLSSLQNATPLVHHITNNVVKNFSANVTLAIGASPVMSELADEFEEFASTVPSLALVINLGTPSEALMEVFIHALQTYNKHGKHVVFDPVACGASLARLEATKRLLNAGHPSVIKGNVGEILAVWKLTSSYQALGEMGPAMRGVDSITEFSPEMIIRIGQDVARDFKAVLVVTGATNYIFDGIGPMLGHSGEVEVAQITGGSSLMGSITGTGCSLGSTIAAFIASKADGQDNSTFSIFAAVVGAVELYNKAGKLASEDASTPGTFMTKFLDHLYSQTH